MNTGTTNTALKDTRKGSERTACLSDQAADLDHDTQWEKAFTSLPPSPMSILFRTCKPPWPKRRSTSLLAFLPSTLGQRLGYLGWNLLFMLCASPPRPSPHFSTYPPLFPPPRFLSFFLPPPASLAAGPTTTEMHMPSSRYVKSRLQKGA